MFYGEPNAKASLWSRDLCDDLLNAETTLLNEDVCVYDNLDTHLLIFCLTWLQVTVKFQQNFQKSTDVAISQKYINNARNMQGFIVDND